MLLQTTKSNSSSWFIWFLPKAGICYTQIRYMWIKHNYSPKNILSFVNPRVSRRVGQHVGGIGFFTFTKKCHKVYLIVMLGLGFVFGLFLGLRLLFLFACWVKLERHFMTLIVCIDPHPQDRSWCNPGHKLYVHFIQTSFMSNSLSFPELWHIVGNRVYEVWIDGPVAGRKERKLQQGSRGSKKP